MSDIIQPFAESSGTGGIGERGLCPFMSVPLVTPDAMGRPMVSHVASACTPNCALFDKDADKCTILTLAKTLDLLPIGSKVENA